MVTFFKFNAYKSLLVTVPLKYRHLFCKSGSSSVHFTCFIRRQNIHTHTYSRTQIVGTRGVRALIYDSANLHNRFCCTLTPHQKRNVVPQMQAIYAFMQPFAKQKIIKCGPLNLQLYVQYMYFTFDCGWHGAYIINKFSYWYFSWKK